MRDPYEVLGVRPDSPGEVIDAAYKAMAKKRHPDAGGSNTAMREVNEAYERIKADQRPAEDAAPEPDQPAAPGETLTESGYAYTVVDETSAAPAPKIERERVPLRVSRPLLAALIIVPAVVAGVAAWLIASSLSDSGGGGARTSANVASVINAFSQGQGGAVRRIEGELPPGLPADIPSYPGAEVVSSLISVTGDDVVYLVIYDTGARIEDVADHFDGALSADPWQIDGAQDGRDSALRQFTKIDNADVEGLVLLAESKDRDLTTIFLSIQVTSGADDTELEEFVPRVTRQLPEDYPEGIPQYPDAIAIETGFSRAPQGTRYDVSLITKDSISSVLEFFRDEFEGEGWTVTDADPSQSTLADAEAITFESGDASLSGGLVAGEFADDANYTRVDLTVLQP